MRIFACTHVRLDFGYFFDAPACVHQRSVGRIQNEAMLGKSCDIDVPGQGARSACTHQEQPEVGADRCCPSQHTVRLHFPHTYKSCCHTFPCVMCLGRIGLCISCWNWMLRAESSFSCSCGTSYPPVPAALHGAQQQNRVRSCST